MEFEYTTNDTCHTADGLVVVIDVLRAFSTAAYALAAGAESITLVSGADEALALKMQTPNTLVMGEVHGLPPKGFDFGNSPTEVVQHDLRGKHLIQRTSAGTQGVVRSTNAENLFAASFVVAEATVRAIQHLIPIGVTFVITGRYSDGEDRACAEYLEARLRGQTPDPEPYLERVRNASELLHMPADQFPHIASDVDYCTRLDAFPFAMPISREQNHPVMRAIVPASRISTPKI
jgi:2-phosphosulfolactate phosphatase